MASYRVVVTFVDHFSHHGLAGAESHEHRFRSVLDQACGIAIQGCDKHGRVIYWNRGSEQLFGHHHDRLRPAAGRVTVTTRAARGVCRRIPADAGRHGEVPAPTEQVLLRRTARQHRPMPGDIGLPDGGRNGTASSSTFLSAKSWNLIWHATTAGSGPSPRHRHWGIQHRRNRADQLRKRQLQHLMNRASSELLLGHCWFDLVAAEDVRYVETSWQQALQQGSNLTLELRVRVGDDHHWLRLNGAPVSERKACWPDLC